MFIGMDKIFKVLSNAFSIVGNPLVVGYDNDGTDHDKKYNRYYKYAEKKISN